jgi:hypothetical protein
MSKRNEIEELTFLKSSNEVQNQCYLNRYYIIHKNGNHRAVDSLISKFFFKKIKDSTIGKYDQISFTFYKESKFTNANNLIKNPRDLDRYSQQRDLIWMYYWYKRSNKIIAYKFKNGKITFPKSEVKIKDIIDN